VAVVIVIIVLVVVVVAVALEVTLAAEVVVQYTYINKKLSYHRQTALQLPTWRGLGTPAHSPSAPLATPMHMVESETHNKLTSSVQSTKRTFR